MSPSCLVIGMAGGLVVLPDDVTSGEEAAMNIPRHRAIAREVEEQLDYLEHGGGRSLSPFEQAQLIQSLFPQLEEALNSVDFAQCKNPGKAVAVAEQLRTSLNMLSKGTWGIDEDLATYELLVTDEIDHLLFE